MPKVYRTIQPRETITKFNEYILQHPVKARKQFLQIQVSNNIFDIFKQYYSTDQYYFISGIEVLPDENIGDDKILITTKKGKLIGNVDFKDALLKEYKI